MSKVSRELLVERTTEAEVFQDMTNFELLNDSSTFALSLRLQFPKFSKGFTSSDFESFVKSYIGESNLVSLGRLSFPNEWQMQVTDKDIRENLIRMGKTKINTRTCWISPLSQSEVRGFIHWIPTAISNNKIENLLRVYGEVLLMENQKNPKWKTKIDCDSRYFGLYLKSGKTMDDLPHFIKIDDYRGLITIRGRNPSCFHCKEIGHRKSECKKYREKLSDYSMRPQGSAKPRYKPRGKRFKKNVQSRTMNQEVQTENVTCSECLRERLEAEAAAQASAAAEGSTDEKDVATEDTADEKDVAIEGSTAENYVTNEGSTAEKDVATVGSAAKKSAATKGSAAKKDVATKQCTDESIESSPIGELGRKFVTLSVGDPNEPKPPGFWRKYHEEKKLLKKAEKEKKQAELNAMLHVIQNGPTFNMEGLLESYNAQGSKMKSVPELSSSEKDSTSKVQEKKSEVGSLSELEQFQKNVYDVLAAAKANMELQFATARQLFQDQGASTAAAGDGKKKRKKRKKKPVAVEKPVDN